MADAMDTSGSEVIIQKTIQGFLDILEDVIKRNNIDEWQKKSIAQIRAHLKMGGVPYYNTIPQKFSNELKKALKNTNIPYVTTPTSKDEEMFIIRGTDKEAFYQAQLDVYQRSTDYVKETTISRMLSIERRHNCNQVITYQIDDEAMRAIAKQKMFQNGVTCAEGVNEKGEKILVPHPEAMFKANGKDLASFELDYALTQMRSDPFMKEKYPELLDIRLKQAAYDQKILNEFAKNIKLGTNSILGNSKNGTSPYIEAKNGECFLMNFQNGTWNSEKVNIEDNASIKDIAALLSLQADKIYDMQIIPEDLFNLHIKNNPNIVNDPAVENFNQNNKQRPKLTDLPAIKMKNFLEVDFAKKANDINMTTSKTIEMAYPNATQEQKYTYKKNMMANAFRDFSDPEIKTLIDELSSISKLTEEEAKKFISGVADHLINESENSIYEINVVKESRKSLEKVNMNVPEIIKEEEIMKPEIEHTL